MWRRRNGKEKKMKRKYPGANCIKQTGDNGKNETRDDGKKKEQGIMVQCDTRFNGKKVLQTIVKNR